MAGTITFDGLATGINTTDTVNKLMDVASRPKIFKQAEQTRSENEQTAWQDLNTKLLAFRDQEQNLWKSATWNTIKISSSNSSVLTATASAGAAEGNSTLSVEQLALNGQKVSKSYDSQTSLIGAGTLSLKIGATTKSIDVTATDTLSTLSDKINSLGVDASSSLIKDGGKYKLLISADKTGLENDVSLTGDVATGLGLTIVQSAQDAIIKFGTDNPSKGSTAMTFTSASNKVEGVINGVTLNLVTASPGEPITLSTSRDNSSVKDEIQKFVDSYNEVVGFISKLTAYDAKKQVSAVLSADGTVRNISDRIRSMLSNTVGSEGQFKTLRSIGFALKDDGTISINQETLGKALAGDYKAVEKLFRDTDRGLMPRLDKYLKNLTSPITGLTDKKIVSIGRTIDDFKASIAAMDIRLSAQRDSLMEQFTAMESAVKGFNSQSDFLTSQLSGINKNWGG